LPFALSSTDALRDVLAEEFLLPFSLSVSVNFADGLSFLIDFFFSLSDSKSFSSLDRFFDPKGLPRFFPGLFPGLSSLNESSNVEEAKQMKFLENQVRLFLSRMGL